jgi:hypothetical protein
MEVSVMMAPTTSNSQFGADFCCGWGNWHICMIPKPIIVVFFIGIHVKIEVSATME